MSWRRHVTLAVTIVLLAVPPAQAQDDGVAAMASMAFARNCFSPFMTAARAEEVLASTGARVDFYDLDPLSNGPTSPVVGRPATPGTDRRCEVAFDGDYAPLATSAATTGLDMEGITTEAPVPENYTPTEGTALLAARQLNPSRVAVVHVGTRPGPNGLETFMLVERLTPEASSQ
ncbi:succinyl-CoA synthetase subunit beta [Gymnodinialimonas sp. 57CJ19]|uniref:succinyl-CoA synthetase subunit beta n=1 Tax=Gymnodinialimonas sp. 57CJ19 TaxID=3138498 RepID=UPI0031343293